MIEAKVLGRYRGRLFQCGSWVCARYSSPRWIPEASGDGITATDLGLFQRCIRDARGIRVGLAVAGVARGPALDWGGGYVTLTRLPRDSGIDCSRWDPHCPNLFARGFQVSPDGCR